MQRADLSLLKQRLWPRDAVRPARLYAVLDCARHASIYKLIERSYRQKTCLFAGNLDPELEQGAPFLLELNPGDHVTDELLLHGWQDFWGILIQTESGFQELRRHLRTLLRVRTQDGRFLLFRFYDPRTLNAYLPTCTTDELALVFGDVVSQFFSYCPETAQGCSYALDPQGQPQFGAL